MQFLDKLENLLINSDNINCSTWTYFNSNNLYICISATSDISSDVKERYIKHYIGFLKDESINLPYEFMVDIFDQNNNMSMLDEILTLNPSEEELLVIFKHSKYKINDTKAILTLLNNKNSFITMVTFANNKMNMFKDIEFLDMCFSHGKKFHLSKDDCSHILIGYINNTYYIANRDEVLQLCLVYVEDEEVLQSLIYKMYGQEINLNSMIVEKQLTNIEINRLHLIKNYTLISEIGLGILLKFFVHKVSNCLKDLSYTSSIEYLTKIDDKCTFSHKKTSVFSLLLDTTNSTEVLDIFDCYLQLFVKFNQEDSENSIHNFKQHIEDNPQIFQNFIIYKKLGNTLNLKNNQNDIIKI